MVAKEGVAGSGRQRGAAGGGQQRGGAGGGNSCGQQRGGGTGNSRQPKRAGTRVSQGGKQQERVLYDLTKPVFFVGFMGAGKTSVARRLARLCGVAAVDMDTYLERREDRRVKDIFAEEGEGAFRALETEVLRELSGKEPLLVSCGGGVVVTPENRDILRSAGHVVYLQVTADEARGRISDLSTRPLFTDLEAARQRNAERLPLYEEVADLTVNTAGKGVSAIAYEVRDALRKEGILCRRPK